MNPFKSDSDHAIGPVTHQPTKYYLNATWTDVPHYFVYYLGFPATDETFDESSSLQCYLNTTQTTTKQELFIHLR